VIHRIVHTWIQTEGVKRAAARQTAKNAANHAAQFPPIAPRGPSDTSPILTRTAGRGR